MEAEERGGSVFVTGVRHFAPSHTFDCGQCFRWDAERDGSYTGVAYGRVVNVSVQGGTVEIKNTNAADFNKIWKKYFDFCQNYDIIKNSLSHDEVVARAMACGWGIRILRQDLWETLVSFILSANNNIRRIKGIIGRLCEMYGQPLNYAGKTCYTFPSCGGLSGITAVDLAPLRAGYRAGYIVDAVNSFPHLDLETIRSGPLDKARRELMRVRGVGPKVADCILLFGAGRTDAFPVDVWIKRVMDESYGGFCNNREAERFAEERFGAYAGYAQQYLFYYRRGSSV